MSKRASIVVTTIHEPDFLDGFVDDIRRKGREEATEIIVIPDRKTPKSLYERCAELASGPIPVLCPDIAAQQEFLGHFPSLEGRLPFDTDHRRNVGFLMALDRGADLVISIDDDNYCVPGSDFVGTHLIVGDVSDDPVHESDSGWMNVCEMLEHEPKVEIYPRGFPYFARNPRTARTIQDPRVVAINAGLWTGDPDVDAITRLALNPTIESLRGGSVLLAQDTWTPINTQNTAVRREALAAFWFVRMGFFLGGMTIDRYGDILSGYFCARCVKSMGETIRIGTPVADHRRTRHNLFKDLYHELAVIVLLEDILPWLVELHLDGASYVEVYESLSHALEEQAPRFKGFVWDDGGSEFLISTAQDMRAWLAAVRSIG